VIRFSNLGISMPTEAFIEPPHVQWTHIDGPLMSWAGHLHWLTWRERLAIWLRLTSVEATAQKHWPQRRKFAHPARAALTPEDRG
jgi:hypothetical protein